MSKINPKFRQLGITPRVIDFATPVMPKKFEVVVENLIEICPGKMHGWFSSNVGIIRKPLDFQS